MDIDRRTLLRTTGAALAASPLSGLGVARAAEATHQFDRFFLDSVRLDPNRASRLGVATADGRAPIGWTVKDDAWHKRQVEIAYAALSFYRDRSDLGTKSDRALFQMMFEDVGKAAKWRDHTYAFYASTAPHIVAQSILLDFQPIKDSSDASRYLARVASLPSFISDQQRLLEDRAVRGFPIPYFNIPITLESVDRTLSEIDKRASSRLAIANDFEQKSRVAGLANQSTTRRRSQLERLFQGPIREALKEAAQRLTEYGKRYPKSLGVCAQREGEEHYRYLIEYHAGVQTSPEAIHAFGLEEVKRIRSEIANLGPRLGCRESSSDVLAYLASDKRFYYPANAEGRERYIREARECLARASSIIPKLVSLPLRADFELREVDPVAAPTAGRAAYLEPSLKSKTGIFYLNTFAMSEYPVYQLPAIVHHEAVPGHHLQAAVVAGEDRPLFRRQLYINSFAEGWGLYAERLADEFGLYQTPEAEAGMHMLALFRAVRLVVDTGMHHYGWSLERAIDYMNSNTANAPGDNIREAQRYLNWPGQALGYAIGMETILSLRAAAERQLGEAFDLRLFHDAVLREGSVNAEMLTEQVDSYISGASAFDNVIGRSAP